MSRYIDLAKKLKALADRGIGGEKINAEIQLLKLMQRYGITIEEIEGDQLEARYFKVPKDGRKLFHQICATVIDRKFDIYLDRTKKGSMLLEVTASEAIEIECKFEFYYTALIKELDVFYSAFIAANNLYPKNAKEIDIETLSEDELKRIKKARIMARGIDSKTFNKQIEA